MRNNKQENGGNGGLTALAVLLCIAIAPPLHASESAYGLGYLLTHSDNVARAPTNERSDNIHSLLAGFAYQENTVDLVARVLGQVKLNSY